MTKKQIIQAIQLEEAATFLAFKKACATWGPESSLAHSLRSEWIGVSNLLQRVGIVADYRLPDNQAATELIAAEVAAARLWC